MNDSHVVFIGGGPVGLYSAIQVKLYCPEIKIRVYEKYEEYQRKHVLIIDENSYSEAHPNPEFRALVANLVGKVPTSTIEGELLAFAKKLGIEVVYKKVESCEEVASENPQAVIMVGSDGSHSLVRKQMFGDTKLIEDDLQYIAELKYRVKGSSSALSPWSEYLPALTLAKHFVSEFVSKEIDGESAISIRFFIDQATFEEIQDRGITFKNPLNLTEAEKITTPNISALIRDMKKWLIARKDLRDEVMCEHSEKITAINLPVYRSEFFAKETQGKTWFLVGDAAMGVPYFRALNAGFLCANQLAIALDKHFHPQPLEPKMDSSMSSFRKISCFLSEEETIVDQYNRKISNIANSEITNARWKNMGVKVGQSSAYSVQHTPVSSLKLPKETRKHMKAIDGNHSCTIL